jgi:hypothetical protein
VTRILIPSLASRCRSLALPCSLLRLGRRRPDARGLREARAAGIRRCWPAASVAFAPVQSCCFRPGSPLGSSPDCSDARGTVPLPSSRGIRAVGESASLRSRHPSPLHRHDASESTPTAIAGRFGAEGATLAACSVLVVSHHLDGFLLQSARGLVASRCRSWGSPRFRRDPLVSEPILAFPATYFAPLEGCSPRVAAPRHRGRCLLAVFTTSRLCSTFGSGTHARDCSPACALSFLGFVPPSRSFRTATGSLLPSVGAPHRPRTWPKPVRADSRSRRATARLAEASPVTGCTPPRWRAGSAREASPVRVRSRTPRIRRPRREARTTSA